MKIFQKFEAIDAVERLLKKDSCKIIGSTAHELTGYDFPGRNDVIVFWTMIENAAQLSIDVLFVTQKKDDGKVVVTKLKEGHNLQLLAMRVVKNGSVLWIKFSTSEDGVEDKEVSLEGNETPLMVQK